ncbi:MAG: hypothetical protein KU37_04255 [Sulfuricurvum sp. PC08-66]|nr:MAG: hypothetical protein KU37_04255 [Sulfuricurvum sp. PC08-66]
MSYKEIKKYALLEQFFEKVSYRRICKFVYGFAFDGTWYICDIYGEKFFKWDFLQRRQLFLELVAYSMEQKKIKFGRKASPFGKSYAWDESTSIEDTIAYLEKGFTKSEEIFTYSTNEKIKEVQENFKIDSNNWMKEVLEYPKENIDIGMYGYFFSYAPWLFFWHEESQSWIES